MYRSQQLLSLRLLILLTALVVVFLLISGRVDASIPGQLPISHRVAPGETLWRIAGSVAGPDQDIREVITDIKRLNDLATSTIRAGQVLLVPSALSA